jgi:hypothetical protein
VLAVFEKHARGKRKFLSALPESVFELDDTIFVVAEMGRAQRLIETQRLSRTASSLNSRLNLRLSTTHLPFHENT